MLSVFCPSCGRLALKVDDYATVNLSAKCRKCKKLVTYHPEDGSISTGNVPTRTTSSGMRFY